MSVESRVLSNIPYSIHNRSNYDIVTKETRDIVDVPYFPAQNLVDVSGKLNVYKPDGRLYIAFLDSFGKERLFNLIERTDARYLFVELADDARYLHYAFAGTSFPQGREDAAVTYDGHNFYLFAGYSDGRCNDDLWQFNLDKNAWANLNFSYEEVAENEAPSKRRKASIVKTTDKIWLFGGETDILSINSNVQEYFITLNDLWSFDIQTKTWKNYDKNRVLPHRPGHIVHIDSTKVRIYIEGGINDTGQQEPAAVWTINIVDDTVTSTPYTAPFQVSTLNVPLVIDGVIHILVSGGDLYKWDEVHQVFTLVKSNIVAVNPETKVYWKTSNVDKDFGQQSTMGNTTITEAYLYDSSDTLISTKTINLPPRGQTIPRINIDNLYTFFYGGLIDGTHFNESTYLMNHQTRQVEKLDFTPDKRPTERVFPSLAYDRYRGRIWLFGGTDGTQFYNDLWYFDLGEKKWYKVHDQLENTDETTPTYPQPRNKASMAVVNTDYIYIIGGYSDVRAYSDFWMYRITTDEWFQVTLVDNIPWGSQYFLFEWRDRLWFYNGQKLYRYFYKIKQFVDQPFLIGDKSTNGTGDKGLSEQDEDLPPIAKLIVSKKYLDVPIDCTVVNDTLFVQSPSYSFKVDMVSRVLTDLKDEYNITNFTLWLDKYYGTDIVTLSDYYINVSPLQPLTRNQLPSSWYSGPIDDPLRDGIFFTDYSASVGENRWTYMDRSGIFRIQHSTIELDKGALLLDHNISVAGTTSELPDVNFGNTDALWSSTIDTVTKPYAYLFQPWFLYSKYKPLGYFYTGAQKVFKNDQAKRVYIIYKNGNTLRYNPIDNTFFVYFTKLWQASAIGYIRSTNKIYAFGGLRNDRQVYMQNGITCTPIEGTLGSCMPGDACKVKEYSHCGLLEFDLNMNELNLGSIQTYLKEHQVTSIDYTKTRDYLLSLVDKYITGYAENTLPATLDQVRERIYTATQPIVDDLSQFDFAFEQGTRPYARAYSASVQVGDRLFVFGGAQVYNKSCGMPNEQCYPIANAPFWCSRPTTLEKAMQCGSGNCPFDPEQEGKAAYIFNMSTRNWTQISPMPTWRYLHSAIVSPDNRYIYIVGGCTEDNCKGLTKSILRYDVQEDKYEEILGLPDNFAPRALPILEWLDDEHLLIMYGIQPQLKISKDKSGQVTGAAYIHWPLNDAWIYDLRSHLFYKAFEDYANPMGIIARDSFYSDQAPESNHVVILSPMPAKDNEGHVYLPIYDWDLVSGDVSRLDAKVTNEIMQDWNGMSEMTKDKLQDSATDSISSVLTTLSHNVDQKINSILTTDNNKTQGVQVTLGDLFINGLKNTNFRFRYAWLEPYGPYNHTHMFIVGERIEESGIEAMEEVARGHKEAHLRFWKVDLEMPYANRYLFEIVYDYPLPISPVAIAYDGKKYMYVIYNKYNIWRLDFKKVLEDPSGSWWSQLPPCIDCNFLGDDRMDPHWDTFFIPPKYLALFSVDGKLARMDTETFTWFLDKRLPPVSPIPQSSEKLTAATGVDQNEVYLFQFGGISGKVMNVFERQWDNFFFDMTVTAKTVAQYKEIISQKLWPTVLKRRRLYTMNELGHIFYSWLRIDGKFDVEYQLQDYYQGDEIRVYGDYTYLQNWTNTRVWVKKIDGQWQEISHDYMTEVTNEVGWDWDGNYTRRYIRQFYDNSTGQVLTQYSKLPPNYLKVDLNSAFGGQIPINKIRVQYENKVKPYNYMTHINRVELITYQTDLAAYDSPTSDTPIQIAHIEPMTLTDNYSSALGITIKNTHPSKSVKNVVVYAWDNNWIQFTMDTSDAGSWTIRDQNNPFFITDELGPGATITFYIRAVNIDLRPHIKDLVIKGIFAYS